MKNNKMFSRLGAAIVATLLFSSLQLSFAAGTPAGTAISNQASVSYNAGSNVRSATSNILTIYVGQKIVIDFTPASAVLNTVDGVTVLQAFTVTNNGNGDDTYNLTMPGSYGNWTSSIVATDGVTPVSSSGLLTAGSSFSGKIKVVIPASEADNLSNAVTLTATSTAANSVPAHIVVLNPGIAQTYVWTITITKPVLSFSVTPAYGANKIPGETQSFDLTITNTGHSATSGSSTVTWLYDATNLTGVIATGGTTQSASAGTATWTIPSVIAATGTVTLNVTAVIEQSSTNGTGVLAGTTITNGSAGSKVDYNDGTNSLFTNVSAPTAFVVGRASGALLARSTANTSGNPGDNVDYTVTVKNTGNASDTYTLSDIQAAGDLDVIPVYSTTVGGSAVSQPVTIGQGVTATYYVRFVVPGTASDAQTIIRTVTATALSGLTAPTSGTVASSNTITTTVTAPQLTIAMSDSAASGNYGTAANPYPGDIIYYIVRITNSGTGSATSVVSSNLTAHTVGNKNAYVTNSLEVDANWDGVFEITPITDGTSFAGGSVAVSSGTVSVTFTTIPALGTKVYRYRVAIQ